MYRLYLDDPYSSQALMSPLATSSSAKFGGGDYKEACKEKDNWLAKRARAPLEKENDNNINWRILVQAL